ncbi:MAG: modification methylase, partial [Flavobacterium sp.]|nr:modification methylase [Flavobacterium sp.]
ILPFIPEFKEFREPFIGGGSVFIALKQEFPNRKYWINDLNSELIIFWKVVKKNLDALITKIKKIKHKEINGKKLYDYYVDSQRKFVQFDRAVRFFIVNRITFSGTIDSGGYSHESYEKRFTESSIKRLAQLKGIFDKVRITNYDYSDVIEKPGKDVFIFLDPPYYLVNGMKLYGKNGDLHTTFNHELFADRMKKCRHKWLTTYNDCKKIRELFSFANIVPWKMQYGMNNYKKKKAIKGSELFISNYPLNFPK